jgi:glutathione S-transferase
VLRLIHYRLCPLSRTARTLLAELKVEATFEEERPWEWRREFAAINPSGELPVLLDPARNLSVCGVYAVVEHLADAHPRGPVLPPEPAERAETRRLLDWFNGKCLREATADLLDTKIYDRFRNGGAGAPDPEHLRTIRTNLRYHLRYLEHLASSNHWLAGASLSAADFAAAAHVSVFDYLGELDWADVPNAREWYARMKSRPALRAILADRVPGTAPPPAHYADPDF